MLKIVYDNFFKRQLKSCQKKRYNMQMFQTVLGLLSQEAVLPAKYKDHSLSGNWKGHRECHIEPDWLLIYRTTEDELILIATGSHDDLFK